MAEITMSNGNLFFYTCFKFWISFCIIKVAVEPKL